jgi:hypothetical protein
MWILQSYRVNRRRANDLHSAVDVVSFNDRHTKSEYQNATVQIWEEPDIQIPQVASQSTARLPVQRRTLTRAEALEIRHSPSKMQIYCNYSIYTIYSKFLVHEKPVHKKLTLAIQFQKD